MNNVIVASLAQADENFWRMHSDLQPVESGLSLRRQQMRGLEDRISRLEQENRLLTAALAKLNAAHERATRP